MAENDLSRDDLVQREKNGFGLFQRRGKTATIASAIMFVIAIIITVAVLFFTVKEKEKEFYSQMITMALHTLCVVLGEMIRRFFLMCEEFKHRNTRYEGEWKRIFKATFPIDDRKRSLVAAIIIIIACLLFGYLLYERYEILPRPDFVIFFFLHSLVVDQLSHICSLRQLAPVETSDLIEKENRNVAYGLAWGYYFGYLKLVLPKLKDQIEKSRQFRRQIRVKKLFILVPKTCVINDNIVDADSRVKWVANLPMIKRNSGGIRKRSYKSGVHMIQKRQPDGTMEKHFFVVEYATTLKTLYHMSECADNVLNREERHHQVG